MAKPSKKSALSERESNPGSPTINPASRQKIKAFRKKEIEVEELIHRLLKGDKTALGRAITLVESQQPDHLAKAEKVVEACLPHAHQSVRIGITGVPGVGKSTFIEAFGSYLVGKGKKVAVLAVDPSSTVSHGSILGDKTRMEKLVTLENAFIRPSPSGESLGGVAQKTRESIILCEAAGFDVLLIETVGVGQSETTVHSMTDFFLLLKLAGAGDELQGIKRGIIEMADAIVINKADGENQKAAREARLEFKRALHLYPPKQSGWRPKVLLSSAIENTGIPEIWELIEEFTGLTKGNNYFEHNRHEQNKFWLLQTINEHLKSRFYRHPEMKKALQKQLQAIENNETSPFAAAAFLLKKYDEL
ncbi:methylmalonyl Co-A mutase-associated GTPase MeaB [Antarcticibacterium arcticum]|uniref:Methylmalonyl Co-A mutase-associated GTPase MeaB n=1 Tax=Antarcticibacterium arcticum TaxID=2585771 RepID=A0A5B8YMD9_9FLAO|nr:methylmalonyl Co-A mutase-associated GTPase MeaB [Antarcticibacterium arcticum]QED37803.1 methylmalonyl Co-A mutase-associated GTPase MeaB [Antarcticibacterium arcticum]